VGKIKLLCPTSEIGMFDTLDLVIGQEYLLRIENDNRASVMIDGKHCMVVYGKEYGNDDDVRVIGLGDGVIDSLDYNEFFYTESEIRDKKLNELIG